MNERNRLSRRRKTAAIAVGLLLSGFIALSACSNNGEGERCQTANNSDDCENGLICLAASQVNAPYSNADRCCPPDRSRAVHPGCKLLTNPVAGDSEPPPDTGPVVTDSGADASEAATDAAADADAGELDAADASDGD